MARRLLASGQKSRRSRSPETASTSLKPFRILPAEDDFPLFITSTDHNCFRRHAPPEKLCIVSKPGTPDGIPHFQQICVPGRLTPEERQRHCDNKSKQDGEVSRNRSHGKSFV